MNEVKKKLLNRRQRAHRVRSTITGTAERPRLSVKVSNTNVYAQIIDDTSGKTLVSSSSAKAKEVSSKPLSEKANWVGADIAKKAKASKVNAVVFDKSHKAYHGRVKAVAEAARKEGLEL